MTAHRVPVGWVHFGTNEGIPLSKEEARKRDRAWAKLLRNTHKWTMNELIEFRDKAVADAQERKASLKANEDKLWSAERKAAAKEAKRIARREKRKNK